MKRVLVSDSMAAEVVEILNNAPGIKVEVKTNLKPEELKAIIKDYDALIVRSSTKATAEIIEAATKLAKPTVIPPQTYSVWPVVKLDRSSIK